MTNEQVLQKAIETYGEDSQIDMMIEEMSELTQALLKLRRNTMSSDPQYMLNVCEEIADVEIVLQQMKMIFNNDWVTNFKHEKIARLKERIRL